MRINSKYTEKLAERILDELMQGKSLVKICEQKGMPKRLTVVRWLHANPDFANKYDRARETQADYMDDRILDVANESNADTAAADRLRIDAYKWRAARLRPDKYGDVKTLQHQGPKGGPVQVNLAGISIDELRLLETVVGKIADTSDEDVEADQGGNSEAGS